MWKRFIDLFQCPHRRRLQDIVRAIENDSFLYNFVTLGDGRWIVFRRDTIGGPVRVSIEGRGSKPC